MSSKSVRPQILIISNKHDYSSDHVTFQLDKLGASYLRLNRDQLPEFELSLIPTEQIILGKAKDFTFQISAETLISVYFRAPIYLRDTYKPSISPDLQLGRSQWAAFIRSFLMFEDVLWVNHPRATYQAEVKPYQLYLANKLGFKTPKTVITNDPEQQVITKPDLIIKTLDPVILSLPQGEAFVYTNFIKRSELQTANLSGAPVILQEAVVPKVDIRVTVIGKNAYPVSITKGGKGIEKDWRLTKNEVQYNRIELPIEIEKMCLELTHKLGLQFGGIDLALKGEDYYFIEINPTGEWAWLLEPTKWPIDNEIAKLLMSGRT